MLSIGDIFGVVRAGAGVVKKGFDLWPGGGGGNGINNLGLPIVSAEASRVPDSPYIPDIIEDWAYGGQVAQTLKPCGIGDVMMQPQWEQRMKCAKGYVAVRCRGAGGEVIEACMMKPVARAMGLWKPRRKPPISATDYRALGKAERTVKKLTNIAKRAGALPKPKRRSR